MELWVSHTGYESYTKQDSRIRVRRYDSSLNRLYVAENGKGLIEWQSGDYLTIYDHFP
jgi:hypothetical protein